MGGNHERNGGMTVEEEEKREILSALRPAHVSIRPTVQRPCWFPSHWWCGPTSQHHFLHISDIRYTPPFPERWKGSSNATWLDLIRRADVSQFEGWSWKRDSKYSLQVLDVFCSLVLWLRSCSDSSPVSHPVSSHTQCAYHLPRRPLSISARIAVR